MKNVFKVFGIIALVAIIGFSMAACGGGDDNPTPNPNPELDDEGSSTPDTAVTLNSVTADGSASSKTTQLTLTFSQAITGLSANDITLSGVSNVTKGTLSSSGATYTLPISGFTASGSLSVAVAKSSYTISGSPKTVTIYYYSGGDGGTQPTFYWGNYIPETQIMAGCSSSAVFNLEDFIANINNSRKRHDLDWDWDAMDSFSDAEWDEWEAQYGNATNIIINQDGSKKIFNNAGQNCPGDYSQYAITTGNVRWKEIKSNEPAAKASKTIDYPEFQGFVYFVSPESYGNIIVKDVAGVDVSAGWTKHTYTIDNLEYNIYRKTTALATSGTMQFKFEFPN